MKQIGRIRLSNNNDLLMDQDMKKIRGGAGYGTGGYSCNCKEVKSVNGYDTIISQEDTTCSSLDLACCTKLSSNYNQMACTGI